MTLREAIDEMTPAKVEAWLMGLPSQTRFVCRDTRRCVIAEYLHQQVGRSISISIFGSAQVCWPGTERWRLPEWTMEFIDCFDHEEYLVRGTPSTPSSILLSEPTRNPEECIRILREVCPQLRGAA